MLEDPQSALIFVYKIFLINITRGITTHWTAEDKLKSIIGKIALVVEVSNDICYLSE